jgi:hypothetical protein
MENVSKYLNILIPHNKNKYIFHTIDSVILEFEIH